MGEVTCEYSLRDCEMESNAVEVHKDQFELVKKSIWTTISPV